MVQAFFVYNLLMLYMIMIWLLADSYEGWSRRTTSCKNLYLVFASTLLYMLVIGLRYDVGGDFPGYLNYYINTTPQVSSSDVPFEIGFYWLIRTLKFFELPPAALFLFTSGIHMIFMSAWLRRHSFLAPYVIYFYFTTLIAFESLNLIRQSMAFMILLYAVPQIIHRKPLKYFFLVGLASTVHVSAWMFLPMYFVLDREWISSRRWQFFILIFIYVSANAIKDYLFDVVPLVTLALGFENFVSIQDDLFFEREVSGVSLGLILVLTSDLIVITVSPWLKRRYEAWGFRAYYNAYYIGMLLMPITYFANHVTFSRLIFYFMSFKFIVLSFIVSWLFDRTGPGFWAKGLGAVLIVMYYVWFLNAIYKGAASCAPFVFVFD